jgi:hypothetical protein
VYATCLFCQSRFESNQTLESFPIGRRIAFDATKGRLWVVCRRCERWNLSAIDERWEAVEDCERLFQNARERISSENIGLARLDSGLELVRIGNALRPEFAAWRYGDQFGRRRRKSIISASTLAITVGAATAGALTLGAVAGGAYWAYWVAKELAARKRRRHLVARVPTSEGETLTVLSKHLADARLATIVGDATGWKLMLPHLGGMQTLRDNDALLAVSLIMPSINGAGGTQRMVDRAVKRLENFDDPTRYLLSAAAASVHPSRPGGALKDLPVDIRLAIEMAVNEENERFLAQGQMFLLELAWEEAEEIAAIADNLTVPHEIEARLEELRKLVMDRP